MPESLPASVVSGVYHMSGVKRESDRVSRLDLDSGYCSVWRRRGARGGGARARRPHVLFKAQAQAATCAAPRIYLPPSPSPPFAASNYKHDRLYTVTIISIIASGCHNRNARHVRLRKSQFTYIKAINIALGFLINRY